MKALIHWLGSLTIAGFTFFIFLLAPYSIYAQKIAITNLKTEYASTPLGIDVTNPRFSWQMRAREHGCYQRAYQIIVTDPKGRQVWNSGKVNDRTSLNIYYSGDSLKPRTKYGWRLTVWDQQQQEHRSASWFETGLLKEQADNPAWHNAQWIGGNDEDMVLYANYLPVFSISFSLQLDRSSTSTKAGFIYGANDSRLMDANKNLYKLNAPKDSSYILLELDIAPLLSDDAAQLRIFRAGYAPGDDPHRPFKSISVPTALLNSENRYHKHTFYLSSAMGDTYIYLDGTDKKNEIGRINLNPLGQGGDFIAFPVLGDIGFSVPQGQTAIFSGVEIRHYRSPSNILFAEALGGQQPYQGIFSHDTSLLVVTAEAYRVTGKGKHAWVIANPSRNAAPMLRSSFTRATGKIEKARLYVTARGIYEIYLNGKRIGNDYFNPGLTQYNKTQLYQTFDVTREIQPGENAWGAVLAEGWWSGGATYMDNYWNFFGDRQSLLAQLIITYSDGREEIITTNPDTWKYYNDGPMVYGSFFQGEVYDATKEARIKNWSTPGFNDAGWKRPAAVSLENHINKDQQNKAANMPMVDDYSLLQLKAQSGPTVKKVRELTAVSVQEVRPGVFVYDMGQNMAGVPNISLKSQTPGSRIILRFAEVRYPALPEYKDQAGMLMLENIRAAMAQEIYIAKGGEEVIAPRFTYHGYRYVEISGISKPLPLTAVKGSVLSSVHEITSRYNTSSAEVNKLWENITWSTMANFMSIPTDCPQRNERLGWSGDISVFSRTATYLADISQFLRRHMLAMRDVQREDGRFADVAPLGGGFGGVLWGSAGITVAWESYQQYGDKELLKEHYEAMKSYIKFLNHSIDPKTGVIDDKDRGQWWSLGDWLSPEYDRTEKSLLWEAYFIYDLDQMANIAALLGKMEDARSFSQLSTERKAFFNDTYIDKKTGKTMFRGKLIDTQCSYAIPLQFNICNEAIKEPMRNNLALTITRENKADNGSKFPAYSLLTGFIGTAWLNNALSNTGRSDLAYKMLQQTSYPSWLYPVTQGATTIWERLNSYTHTNGFGGNNRMNSFNHYSFGAVGAWMYNHSLGIQRDEYNPGFQHFVLAPEADPTKQMSYAQGYYQSMYGKIESKWQRQGLDCLYYFTVPANTTATLYLNAPSADHILEKNIPVTKVKYLKLQGQQNGRYAMELPAGKYEFRVRNTFEE